MSASVAFISDLHLGHGNVLVHTAKVPGAYRGGATVEEHDEWVIEQCLSIKPNKHTLWWLLGDIAMHPDRLPMIDRLPGRKILVMGNHDNKIPTLVYLKHVERIVGMVKKYGMWITHAPIHSVELRGHPNLHGHMHKNELWWNDRYFNACIDWIPNNRPITLDELRETWLTKQIKAMENE